MSTLIYEKKSGKEVKLNHSIDAREWVATGKYVYSKPLVKAQPKQDNQK